jgi:hypothetical protein
MAKYRHNKDIVNYLNSNGISVWEAKFKDPNGKRQTQPFLAPSGWSFAQCLYHAKQIFAWSTFQSIYEVSIFDDERDSSEDVVVHAGLILANTVDARRVFIDYYYLRDISYYDQVVDMLQNTNFEVITRTLRVPESGEILESPFA